MKHSGKFIISLDFELLWGLRDHETIESYGDHIIGAREVFPKLLELFKSFGIKATFATVGFLFASTKEELLSFLPNVKPNYDNKILSPYNGYFDDVKKSEEEDGYHFASKLIKLILEQSGHEISSHTFSHYYCLEKGQTIIEFEADLLSAIRISESKNIKLESIIFPRNQINNEYLKVCQNYGLHSYRGTEKTWFYKVKSQDKIKLIKRAFKLIDTYINISGYNSYPVSDIEMKKPYNIRSSRFLRPYNPKFRIIDNLKIKRILDSMTYAAKKGEVYHLNWHPHNFGKYQSENIEMLRKILTHFDFLASRYKFESVTMVELAKSLQRKGFA